MNQWAFVIAAYGITFFGLFALAFYCWQAMRSAECRAAELQRGKD